jgi:hypothetical protein
MSVTTCARSESDRKPPGSAPQKGPGDLANDPTGEAFGKTQAAQRDLRTFRSPMGDMPHSVIVLRTSLG